ncbi:hypothetical protein JX266_000079 [Neoarthrinium moseri]|nr:hypothetical protein JX266_000079 [Neoarthrinium moseri]
MLSGPTSKDEQTDLNSSYSLTVFASGSEQRYKEFQIGHFEDLVHSRDDRHLIIRLQVRGRRGSASEPSRRPSLAQSQPRRISHSLTTTESSLDIRYLAVKFSRREDFQRFLETWNQAHSSDEYSGIPYPEDILELPVPQDAATFSSHLSSEPLRPPGLSILPITEEYDAPALSINIFHYDHAPDTATDALVRVLSQDEELIILYSQATKRLGQREFTLYHRRLLKLFLRDLETEAANISSRFHLAAQFLRCRDQRDHVTLKIWRYFSSPPAADTDGSNNHQVIEHILDQETREGHRLTKPLDPPLQAPSFSGLDLHSDCDTSDEDTDTYIQLDRSEDINWFIASFADEPAFLEFKSNIRYWINPPSTIQKALLTGSKQVLSRYLQKDFDDVLADSDYHWVQELKEIGCTPDEIADILLEQSRDSPWILFEPQPVEAMDVTPGKHIPSCVHRILDPLTTVLNVETMQDKHPQFERLVQELCGLAGISPLSKDRETWNGFVEFYENDKSKVASALPSDAANSYDSQALLMLPRLIRATEKLYIALGHVQMAGLCCDSFTMLVQNDIDQNVIVMKRIYLTLVTYLLELLRDLSSGDTLNTYREGSRDYATDLPTIFNQLFDSAISTCIQKELWKATDANAALHYCSLATQVLCLAFLSYSQAHVGPLRPFFLDTPLLQVTMLGVGSTAAEQYGAVEASLANLSCVGDMLQSPVLAFRWIEPRVAPQETNQSQQFDLDANAEDMIDTWGPGKLIMEKDRSRILGILLGGGIIHAMATEDDALFHWSPSGVEQYDLCKSFDAKSHILVGATVSVNARCSRNEDEWWRKSCRSLKTLGTCPTYWAQEERQIGMQTGNIVLVQANVTWRKWQGRTLKQLKLAQTDEHLVAFLEDPWGLQVSFCTGVSRRVALREMIADLLPVFARAAVNRRDCRIWSELETTHRVFDFFKKDAKSIRHWLLTLPDDHGQYILQLIRQILGTLQDTGVGRESKQLTVAWPHESDLQKCFQIPCRRESSWVGFLADSEDSATFAYMTTRCLETDRIKCEGSNTCWRNAVPLLETAVLRLQAVLTSQASTTVVLQHKEIYYLKKMDGLFYVKAQRPVVPTGTMELVVWPSISPQNIQTRVVSLLRVRNDWKQRELRERTAQELAWAEEVAVYTLI